MIQYEGALQRKEDCVMTMCSLKEETEEDKSCNFNVTFTLPIIHKWKTIGNKESLSSDTAIATFLIDLYEERKKDVCFQCQAALVPTCINCQLQFTDIQSSVDEVPCSQPQSQIPTHSLHLPSLCSFIEKSSPSSPDLHVPNKTAAILVTQSDYPGRKLCTTTSSNRVKESRSVNFIKETEIFDSDTKKSPLCKLQTRKRKLVCYVEDSDADSDTNSYQSNSADSSLPKPSSQRTEPKDKIKGLDSMQNSTSVERIQKKVKRIQKKKQNQQDCDGDYAVPIKIPKPSGDTQGLDRMQEATSVQMKKQNKDFDGDYAPHIKISKMNPNTKPLFIDYSITAGGDFYFSLDKHHENSNLDAPLDVGQTALDCPISDSVSQRLDSCQKYKLLLEQIVFNEDGSKTFACRECKSTFSRKRSLIKHIRTHTGERPYKCPVCQQLFSRPHHLTRHIRRFHADINPWICDVCNAKFSHKSHLQEHKTIHEIEDIQHLCAHCQTSFSSPAKLVAHEQTHADVLPYACELCGNRYRRLMTLVKHRQFHALTALHCRFCSKSLTDPTLLEKHMLNTHNVSMTTVFPCPYCKISLDKAKELKEHIHLCHPVDISSPSGATQSSISSSHSMAPNTGLLKRHLGTGTGVSTTSPDHADTDTSEHAEQRAQEIYSVGDIEGVVEKQPHPCTSQTHGVNEVNHYLSGTDHDDEDSDAMDVMDFELSKPKIKSKGQQYTCEVCGLSKPDKNIMIRHYRQTHIGLRPYSCFQCSKSFKRSYGLKRHILQIHLKTIPKTCLQCGFIFDNATELQLHWGTCEKAGFFFCKFCSKDFFCRTKFNQHVQTHTSLGRSIASSSDRVLESSSILIDMSATNTSTHRDLQLEEDSCVNKELPLQCDTNIHRHNVIESNNCVSHPLDDHRASESVDNKTVNYNTGDKEANKDAFEDEDRDTDLKMFVEVDTPPGTSCIKVNREQFVCDVCGLTLSHRKTMRRHHQQTHKDLRPFKCSQCPKSFKRNYAVKRHVLQCHDKARPEMCQHCGLRFGNHDQLKRHCGAYYSAGFSCEVCGEGFPCTTLFHKHKKTHFGAQNKKRARVRTNTKRLETKITAVSPSVEDNGCEQAVEKECNTEGELVNKPKRDRRKSVPMKLKDYGCEQNVNKEGNTEDENSSK